VLSFQPFPFQFFSLLFMPCPRLPLFFSPSSFLPFFHILTPYDCQVFTVRLWFFVLFPFSLPLVAFLCTPPLPLHNFYFSSASSRPWCYPSILIPEGCFFLLFTLLWAPFPRLVPFLSFCFFPFPCCRPASFAHIFCR